MFSRQLPQADEHTFIEDLRGPVNTPAGSLKKTSSILDDQSPLDDGSVVDSKSNSVVNGSANGNGVKALSSLTGSPLNNQSHKGGGFIAESKHAATAKKPAKDGVNTAGDKLGAFAVFKRKVSFFTLVSTFQQELEQDAEFNGLRVKAGKSTSSFG